MQSPKKSDNIVHEEDYEGTPTAQNDNLSFLGKIQQEIETPQMGGIKLNLQQIKSWSTWILTWNFDYKFNPPSLNRSWWFVNWSNVSFSWNQPEFHVM